MIFNRGKLQNRKKKWIMKIQIHDHFGSKFDGKLKVFTKNETISKMNTTMILKLGEFQTFCQTCKN